MLTLISATVAAAAGAAVGTISTFAGTGVGGFNGDLTGVLSQVNAPESVAVDSLGNVYIADTANHRVRKVTISTGVMSTVAGNGTAGFGGDGGLATFASLDSPHGMVIDAAGNVYIADRSNHRIRKVTAATGIITTVAGTGTAGFNGDNQLATSAQLNFPTAVAFDGSGNLYIADNFNQRIRKLTAASSVISTVAGTGIGGYNGDGLATGARLAYPTGVAVDIAGNLYIADQGNHRVRKVAAATGVISTVAGIGIPGYSGEAGPATAAYLHFPTGVAVDASGDVYISDRGTYRVRKLSVATGTLSTVAGGGTLGFGGDGGEASAAQLSYPDAAAVDGAGTLYIADTGNHRIRKVTPPVATGTITTVAGGGTTFVDGPATSRLLFLPKGVAVDGAGNVYVADAIYGILKVTVATGLLTTVVPQLAARGMVFDAAGNMYFTDEGQNRVRRRAVVTGIITTVAGTGLQGSTGDGGPATAAALNNPTSVALDAAGNLYIADFGNHRVRKVNGAGVITTVAGNGTAGIGGDGGPATSAQLQYPYGVAVDQLGNIYISVYTNHRIRRVSGATGIISTYAGTGAGGFSGEGGPATLATLDTPSGLAVDSAGNLYIADQATDRVRRIDAITGIISTIAGNGTRAFMGDGGAATAASLDEPFSVAIDAAGRIYVADTYNLRIRRVSVPPAAPTGLNATVLTASAIRLTWTATGAATYTIKRGTTPGSETTIATGVTTTTYVDGGAAAGGTYYYVVTAVVGGEESGPSNEVSATVTGSAVPGDFDHDGRTEITVFRPSTGQWFLRYSSQGHSTTGYGAYSFGQPGDLPIAGDVDGDRQADLTLYRPSTGQWLTRSSAQGYSAGSQHTYQWGVVGDVPVAADFDGDGKLDLTVYRPSSGQWFVLYSALNYSTYDLYQWGGIGDMPQAADVDGDAKTDLVVYRPSSGQWFIRSSTQGYSIASYRVVQWGQLGDVPLVTDFDGDGSTDLTIYRRATGQWFVLNSTLNYTTSAVYQWGAVGDRPVVVDLDGDGRTELAVFRPGSGTWLVAYSSLGYNPGASGSYQWGEASDAPLPQAYDAAVHPGDVDADGKADLTVYRPSTGEWRINQSHTGYNPAAPLTFQWGGAGDVPVAADFDGDRLPDVTVFRPASGQWFIRYSTQGYSPATYGLFQWGGPGDVPMAADLDGDGKADLVVYRPSSGQWFIVYSTHGYSTASYGVVQWGGAGDVPLVGDFDGDGKAEITVYRPASGQWFLLYSQQGYSAASYGVYQVGVPGDTPVVGDFDGDGRAELTVYRPSTGQWVIRYAAQGYGVATAYTWGDSADVPLVRDVDGDGRAELTVYRPSTGQWFIKYSLSGYGTSGVYQWGAAGEAPVPQR